jgi:8-oxo-dGTP diphosphatase
VSVLFLLRHAHAGDKARWPGRDVDRPLTATGRREAHDLVSTFSGVRVRRLVTSPTLRCRQTLAPLAAVLGLEPLVREELAVDADLEAALELVCSPLASGAILCTHGENIGQLLPALVAAGVRLEGGLRFAKASAWRLDGRPAKWRRATYLPPAARSGQRVSVAAGARR